MECDDSVKIIECVLVSSSLKRLDTSYMLLKIINFLFPGCYSPLSQGSHVILITVQVERAKLC